MKITKAVGREAMRCLLHSESNGLIRAGDITAVWPVWEDWGWLDGDFFTLPDPKFTAQFRTALALCAAIAGVKPEDVE